MKQLILVVIGTLFFSFSSLAQKTVKGTVTDQDNMPMPGVSIVEKNTTNGIETDFDGNFVLKVSKNAILIFRYLGYKTQEVVIGDKDKITVVMKSDVSQLDEIVVIGYGSVKRDKIQVLFLQLKEQN